jgi:hypothetical protein
MRAVIMATIKDSAPALRDFLVAVQTGAQVAISMLDDIEGALLHVLRTVDEDTARED